MHTKDFFDLIVIGGGTAGTLCAIAAARSGMKTAIIEKNSYLGGISTGAGLTEMNAAGFQGAPLYQGLEKEIFDQLIQSGHAEYHFSVPMSSNKHILVDRLRYDPEILKIILEEKALTSGVKLFYETRLKHAVEKNEHCMITLQTLYETFSLKSLYLVDATGTAYLIQKLGRTTIKPVKDQQLTSTLMFRLSGVNTEMLSNFIQSGQISNMIEEGYNQQILKGKILAFTPIPGSHDVSLNVTRTNCDYEHVEEYSTGIANARSQILPIYHFIREKIPGMENCYISNIAPFLGVRDGRRICGVYTLTLHDLEQMTAFDDPIAFGCYPMDFHDPTTKTVIWKSLPGIYHIPFRSLLPIGLKRTLAVGKCLSAEQEAFSAIRVMPIMMNVGESAGYLLSLAKIKQCFLTELDAQEMRNYLAHKYHHIL